MRRTERFLQLRSDFKTAASSSLYSQEYQGPVRTDSTSPLSWQNEFLHPSRRYTDTEEMARETERHGQELLDMNYKSRKTAALSVLAFSVSGVVSEVACGVLMHTRVVFTKTHYALYF